MMPPILRALGLLALAATTADATVLPLKPGTFVLKDQPCASPPFAATFDYDGRAFSYPHASHCISTTLSHVGRTYRQRETCSALGDGAPATPVTTVSTYQVVLRTEVRVSHGPRHAMSSYRWCPASK